MNLPPIPPSARDHQQKLLQFLDSTYQAQGEALSFADFMNIALYAPGLGYYSAGMHKFGHRGDFVTAPEISKLFSQCLASQCAQILTSLHHTDTIILELGAGSGRMAASILHYLAKQKCLPKHYWILEVSADLRQRQQTYLKEHCPDFFANIKWLDTLPANPFTGIILGNEVIDAMPVHLFQIGKQGEILEGLISKSQQQWRVCFSTPLTKALPKAIEDLQQSLSTRFAPGYTSEINLGLTPWLKSLSECLREGVMLFIDYGFPRHEYYHASRNMGTLMCHYRHHAHSDPMSHIGLQDITTHVDFTALAQGAHANDLEVAGFTHQAAFLLGNGLLNHAQNHPQTVPQQLAISQQIQQLTHPHEMGELFKAIALTKDFSQPLQGFQMIDHRHKL